MKAKISKIKDTLILKYLIFRMSNLLFGQSLIQ